jgi:hypothetical protein
MTWRRHGPWQQAYHGHAPELIDDEQARAVGCRYCGAPEKHQCSRSRARRTGGRISPGDWRTAHAIRQRDALAKIIQDHAKRKR